MQLDPVETSLHGTACGVDVIRDHTWQLGGLESTGFLEGLYTLLGVDLSGGRDSAGRNRRLVRDRLVADATGVHELREDRPPRACTGSATSVHPATCSVGVQTRVCTQPRPTGQGCVP